MDLKPWFKLNPNNIRDPWWLYSSIRDTKAAANYKTYYDIICYLIFQDSSTSKSFYRVSTWYKNDPNRYLSVKTNIEWALSKIPREMKEGDIVYEFDMKFRVYDCPFSEESQQFLYKILERIEDPEDNIFYV